MLNTGHLSPKARLNEAAHILERLVKLFISIIFCFGWRLYACFSLLVKRRTPQTFIVLMYHAVKPEQRERYEAQMDTLLRVGKAVDAGEPVPLAADRFIAVTFDDGFQSSMENALPAMEVRGIPGVIFVTTGHLGDRPRWITPGHENTMEVLLTPTQLRELPESIIQVGSHCVTHRRLTELTDDEVVGELEKSKLSLEAILGREVSLLSFPYGCFDERILRLSKQLGYKRVFSNIPEYKSPGYDEYLFSRVSVSPQDWMLEYRLKLLGAYAWMAIAIRVKRKARATLGRSVAKWRSG